MAKRIKIVAGSVLMEAELDDSNTAQEIWGILAVGGVVNRWGEEIYFPIPLKLEEENAKDIVAEGDIAFWPSGSCFCIFFGPTPISKPGEIRPASAVNVFGKVIGDAKKFSKVKDGEKIKIEKA
ncbi:MAG: cyclophilin-like fold protein [Candidatus Ratteibacteria bacterium]|nr:cyclophilin-like fold protein [Candidatus Ratteibacteria bacterium]